MTTRRPCKLKFLVEFESLTKIRISVTGCVVTQATKFVANIKSKIICRFLVLLAKFNELLFSTRNIFVACMTILIIRELALPIKLVQWTEFVSACVIAHETNIFLKYCKINIPSYIMENIVVSAVIRAIFGLPPI